jgi:AcrR family transcriptional regulator
MISVNQWSKEARRASIVDMAKQCFENKGLHGASMDYISRETKLSVGQIYRFFSGKEQLIECVARKIIRRSPDLINSSSCHHNSDVILSVLPADSGDFLFLEILAEATRNPDLQSLVAESDILYMEILRRHIRNASHHLSENNVSLIAEFMARLSEGERYRKGRGVEMTGMQGLYNDVLHYLVNERKPSQPVNSGL